MYKFFYGNLNANGIFYRAGRIIFLELVFNFGHDRSNMVSSIGLLPSFRFAEESTFAEFANQHTYRTSLVVGPFMLLEVFSSVVLFWKISPASFYDIFNVVSLILIWGSTLVLSIPCHSKLAAAKMMKLYGGLLLQIGLEPFYGRLGVFSYYLYFTTYKTAFLFERKNFLKFSTAD